MPMTPFLHLISDLFSDGIYFRVVLLELWQQQQTNTVRLSTIKCIDVAKPVRSTKKGGID